MPFDRALLEQYAMQTELQSRKIPTFAGAVNVDEIGEALGLSLEDSRGIARYLDQIKWATLSYGNSPQLTLTPLGFDEIAKLRQPKWRQWIDRHPITMNVFWMTVASSVAGIISAVTTYHFLK